MSITKENLDDWGKWIMRGIISVCSILIFTEHNRVIQEVEKMSNQQNEIQMRLIRIEYELKLKNP